MVAVDHVANSSTLRYFLFRLVPKDVDAALKRFEGPPLPATKRPTEAVRVQAHYFQVQPAPLTH